MLKYSAESSVKLPLPVSPSLLYNNLSVGGGHLAYSHLGEAILLNEVKVAEAARLQSATGGETRIVEEDASSSKRVPCPDVETVHQIKICTFEETFIVLSTGNLVQVWDRTAARLLFSFALPCTGPSANSFDGSGSSRPSVARGITTTLGADNARLICVGSLSGAIFIIELKDGRFQHRKTVHEHVHPITDLGSEFNSSRGTKPSAVRHLISADHHGCIVVWDVQSASCLTKRTLHNGDGIPCVGVAARGQLLVSASAYGNIRIFDLKTERLCLEMTGHSRWLSALDVHPSIDIFATVSEDGVVNAWTLPRDGGKITAVLSACWPNAMLTGVAFCGPGARCIAATSYDRVEVCIWPGDPGN